MQRCSEKIIRFVFCPENEALLFLLVYSGLIGVLIARTIAYVAHDTMTQLHKEEDDARQHPANRLRYPAGVASVNNERDRGRHLAVSSHPLSTPVTGSLPPPSPFCNHSRREEHPSTFPTRFLSAYHSLSLYTAFMRILTRSVFYANGTHAEILC
ncbi:hypothetical protein ALC62_11768 [Cyphomyrmex costatus]|uniref:Uncharacterized protein n=1 Tax=Cyphomyrmex costatus TaxID=456900 RepID=A0A195CB97_9HYME|nr:hypothetical protein ALC62_11768 [Cyphomyrmex costatus]